MCWFLTWVTDNSCLLSYKSLAGNILKGGFLLVFWFSERAGGNRKASGSQGAFWTCQPTVCKRHAARGGVLIFLLVPFHLPAAPQQLVSTISVTSPNPKHIILKTPDGQSNRIGIKGHSKFFLKALEF